MYTADHFSHLPEIETCTAKYWGGASPPLNFWSGRQGSPSDHYWIGIPASFAHFQFLGEGRGSPTPGPAAPPCNGAHPPYP